MLLSDVKFDAAHSALWIVLPVCDSVVLAAMRTRVAYCELPIVRSVHGLGPFDNETLGYAAQAVATIMSAL